MKMDAAEPFNVPVNPEALGIPVSINIFKYLFHGFFLVNLDHIHSNFRSLNALVLFLAYLNLFHKPNVFNFFCILFC